MCFISRAILGNGHCSSHAKTDVKTTCMTKSIKKGENMRKANQFSKPLIQLMNDVVEMNTDELIDMLSESFHLFIESNQIQEHPSVFLHGQPGVGKSQAVYQIARNLEEKTGHKVSVTDIRLLLFTPVDLRGIPVPNMKDQTAVWLKPEVFNLKNDEHMINIVFLDELTSAPSSLQATAYQIALERRLGEHQLPPNTFIIAAGNRQDDHAVSYEMPTALRNRFMHIELQPHLDSWMQWAEVHHIHPKILQFLNKYPDKFYTKDLSTSSPIIITPRTWEMLSKIIYRVDVDCTKYRNLIASVIGTNMTRLLLGSYHQYDIEPILKGVVTESPQSLEETQAMVELLEERIGQVIESVDIMTNIMTYIMLLPIDYTLRVFKNIIHYEPQSYEITSLDVYQQLITVLEEHTDAKA